MLPSGLQRPQAIVTDSREMGTIPCWRQGLEALQTSLILALTLIKILLITQGSHHRIITMFQDNSVSGAQRRPSEQGYRRIS